MPLEKSTYPNFEVIVVDDGSVSNDALEYLSSLQSSNPYRFPLRVLLESNRYLGAARNCAARMAEGEYLLFHDDDNVRSRTRLIDWSTELSVWALIF